MPNKHDVIIIGAGSAGIAAGCRLLENNLKNIIILEARDRIGGRIHSIDVDGSAIDFGAQWCHGEEDNIVYTLAKDLDVLSPSKNNYDNFNIYSPTLIFDNELVQQMYLIADGIANDEEALKDSNESFGDYFKTRFTAILNQELGHKCDGEVIKALLEWLNNFYCCLNACPTWYDLSAKGQVHYRACEGNYYLQWRNKGYKTILDILMKESPYYEKPIPIKEKILLNKIVTKIKVNKLDDITVSCSDGLHYDARQVLVTLPLGVLKQVKICLFEPQLPTTKLNAIESLGFGTVNKIFLKFPNQWWLKDLEGITIIWSEKDRASILKSRNNWLESVFGFYPIDSHSNILLVWIVGPHANEIEKLPDHVLISELMFVLKYFVGSIYPDIPYPLSILCSKWNTDTYARGSYSYRSMISDKMNALASDLGSPVCLNNKPMLMFAGEATSTHQFSTVHGAISSGFREADRIINTFEKIEMKGKL